MTGISIHDPVNIEDVRLLVLTVSGDNTPSVRYRIKKLLSRYDPQYGNIRIRNIPKTPNRRLRLLRDLIWADCVLIQKKLFSGPELRLIRWLAKGLFYDLDDAIHYVHPSKKIPGEGPVKNVREKMALTVSLCDGVFVGNQYLKTEVEEMGASRVKVVPTPVQIPGDELSRPDLMERSGTGLVLGWIGTAENLFYLDIIQKPLSVIQERFPDTRVVIISSSPWATDQVDAEFIKWSPEKEEEYLGMIDIGLMPLTDDNYSRGKCGFKILQYMSAGIPTLASPVGANNDIITHGRNGYLPAGNDEWVQLAGYMIESTDDRRLLGEAARQTAIENYSVKKLSAEYRAVLDGWMADIQKTYGP